MTDPQIACPNCKSQIKLTESLAAPMIAATRASYEAKLQEQSAGMARREAEIGQKMTQLAHAQANLEAQVAERLNAERKALIDQGAKLASSRFEFDLQQKVEELKSAKGTVTEYQDKLKEAQKQQAEFMQKERALEDQKRELELTIEKRTALNAEAIRLKARAETEEVMRLKVTEKEEQIAGMQRQIEELKRKSEQGSQQLQGEVLELDFEHQLTSRFPHDVIEPVPKGEVGADVLHRVMSPSGQQAGIILWELKRTKNWSDGWLAKLRDDQRTVTADIAILVSTALPRNVETFDILEKIHVCHPRAAMPLVTMLRQSLIDIARARGQQQGQASKMEQMYAYLTGPQFQHRVEAVIEKYNNMKDDLDRERKFTTKQWAKREMQISGILESMTGMYGDMQGIAGSAMSEIAALDMPGLEDGSADSGNG